VTRVVPIEPMTGADRSAVGGLLVGARAIDAWSPVLPWQRATRGGTT
jgi:hypothetical protein